MESTKKKLLLSGSGARALQLASKEVKIAAHAYLADQIERLLEKYDLEAMSGYAEGFDTLLAKVAIEYEVPLIAAVPNKGYGRYYWGEKSLTGTNRYGMFQRYIDAASCVVYVMEDVYGQTKGLYFVKSDGGYERCTLSGTHRYHKECTHANFIRNEYMVEHADAFYVYNAASSGTAHCLGLIKAANKPYYEIPLTKQEE